MGITRVGLPVTRQYGGLVTHGAVHRIDKHNSGTAAGVMPTLENTEMLKSLAPDIQPGADGVFKSLGRVIQRQA